MDARPLGLRPSFASDRLRTSGGRVVPLLLSLSKRRRWPLRRLSGARHRLDDFAMLVEPLAHQLPALGLGRVGFVPAVDPAGRLCFRLARGRRSIRRSLVMGAILGPSAGRSAPSVSRRRGCTLPILGRLGRGGGTFARLELVGSEAGPEVQRRPVLRARWPIRARRGCFDRLSRRRGVARNLLRVSRAPELANAAGSGGLSIDVSVDPDRIVAQASEERIIHENECGTNGGL